MKLRIKGNSLRLRLVKQELAELNASGEISESVSFGATRLVYSLERSETVGSLEAQYSGNRISVYIPADIVRELASTDRVGVETTQALDDDKELYLLVEKDFKCLTPREEDTDAFPHPESGCGHNMA